MAAKRKLRTLSPCTQAVTWSRVSSSRQSDGASLTAQDSKNKAYCKEKGFKIIKNFSVVESSTKDKRPEFEKMLEYVASQKKKTAIVVYCVDRFQRNNNPDQLVNKLIAEDKIELHFSNDRFDINISTQGGDNMRFDVSKLSSKWYIDSMKVAQERSIIANLNNGVWLSKAPLGYKNHRIAKRKSIVEIDEIRAPMVVTLFEEYAKGHHSLQTITELAADIGLTSPYSKTNRPLTRQSIHAMLKNPFYYGYMRNVSDELIKHTTGGIISKELFDKVQDILTGRKADNIKTTYKSLPFAFRGVIKCKCCGRAMSSEKHFVKSENDIVNYLRCATPRKHCNQKPVKEQDLFNILNKEVFANIMTLTPQMKKALIATVKKTVNIEASSTKTIKTNITNQINELKSQDDKLLRLLLSSKITESKYDTLKADIDNQIKVLEEQASRYNEVGSDSQNNFNILFEKALNISNIMNTGTPEQQNQVLKLLFEECELEGNNFRYVLKKPFDKLLLTPKNKDWISLDINTISQVESACDDITELNFL